MSSDYFDGFLDMLLGLGNVTMVGLLTASMEGAGWSSLNSASGGA
ncbi:hypothetical protein [Prescottella equi]|nr:hypothetical protein [Prescottella equi]WJJ10781.1 hypothetical protein P9990_19710 [Prescottella equi]SUE02774.1 Uncharacterised protein [Prescottella equi]SUE17320.1 Uncharacterised protein [Prescottella equi]BCN42668.1 hypothetical protein RE9414_09480 [Prescottella equi]BCN62483.1 hypothetical protein RE9431_09380 [Prescottella equi]